MKVYHITQYICKSKNKNIWAKCFIYWLLSEFKMFYQIWFFTIGYSNLLLESLYRLQRWYVYCEREPLKFFHTESSLNASGIFSLSNKYWHSLKNSIFLSWQQTFPCIRAFVCYKLFQVGIVHGPWRSKLQLKVKNNSI